MTTRLWVALAFALACLAGEPAFAATCNLTVQGAHVIDDQACSVAAARGTVRVLVETGQEITVRRSAMSARFGADPLSRRRAVMPLGSVVASDGADDRTCYFGQKAVLCIDR